MIVKQIDAKDTYPIRHTILRPKQTINDCQYEGDFDKLTFHLGGFIDDNLASIASFYLNNHPEFPDEYQFRLRGMATLPKYSGKGLSSALLRTAFPLIKNNHISLLWCNARVSAVGFYEKVGFSITGDEFDIPAIGPHRLMSIRVT